ncbi:gas vesicle protein [Marinococcus sp. PL1-022]|uniref:gas vesicle protein n=1 Tax=Marinococcus sp. PL1-022 TaxID=3095363 RepID=UPI0029C16D8F|nr:gas vesicle protein [Marinococcus sp. PL1-022]MDX6151518.1 gas vesicle protein [Marinococcus sp. PL1-022]
MPQDTLKNREVSLLDVLDSVLDKGVVLQGDVTISIAGIDLVYLDLRVLIASVETLRQSELKTQKEFVSNSSEPSQVE